MVPHFGVRFQPVDGFRFASCKSSCLMAFAVVGAARDVGGVHGADVAAVGMGRRCSKPFTIHFSLDQIRSSALCCSEAAPENRSPKPYELNTMWNPVIS